MALEKVLPYKGVDAKYWMIVQKSWDKIDETSSCRLGLYFTKAAKNANIRNVLKTEEFTFPGDLSQAELYVAIQAQMIDDGNGNMVHGWFWDAVVV